MPHLGSRAIAMRSFTYIQLGIRGFLTGPD